MQIPTSLPTDNLYKFGTILGLVVFAVSMYGWISLVDDRRGQFERLAVESITPPSTQRAEQIAARQRDIVKEVTAMSTVLARCMGGGIGASLLAGIGWYFRHQRHQDTLIVLQVKEAEEKLRQLGRDTLRANMPRWRKPRG